MTKQLSMKQCPCCFAMLRIMQNNIGQYDLQKFIVGDKPHDF